MKIKVEVDPKGLLGRALTEFERNQIPHATSQAINATAFDAMGSVKSALVARLETPSPYTQRSPRVLKSTKHSLFAEVYIADQASHGNTPATYLQEVFGGGARRAKGFELLMQSKGAMPGGAFAVPTATAEDPAGNVKRSTLREVLQLGSDNVGGRMFAVTRKAGKLHPGVYRRMGRAKSGKVRRLLSFVMPKTYRQRLDLGKIVQKVTDRRFNRYFVAEFLKALRSGPKVRP